MENKIKRGIKRVFCGSRKADNAAVLRQRKIEKGAEDFAVRFEDVMRELSNG